MAEAALFDADANAPATPKARKFEIRWPGLLGFWKKYFIQK
jgi:hypothetical protein